MVTPMTSCRVIPRNKRLAAFVPGICLFKSWGRRVVSVCKVLSCGSVAQRVGVFVFLRPDCESIMAERINSLMSDIDARLHQKNMFTDHLETLEKKTGVRRLYLVTGMHFMKRIIIFIM